MDNFLEKDSPHDDEEIDLFSLFYPYISRVSSYQELTAVPFKFFSVQSENGFKRKVWDLLLFTLSSFYLLIL